MKKIMFAALACAAVALTLASCGNSNKNAEEAADSLANDSTIEGVVDVESVTVPVDTIGDTVVTATATEAVGVVAQ